MEMTLSALVKGALSEADQQLKLASAQDVVVEDPMAKIAEEMEYGSAKGDEDEDKKKSKKRDEEDEEEKTSSMRLADHCEKLAEALDHVGTLWIKQATAMETYAGQHNVGDTTQHSRTTPATVPAAQASHGGGPSEMSQGYPAGIDTNSDEFKSPEWKGNPEARQGAIRVKGAKPGETRATGKTASLAQQRALLHRFGGKFAADPSSPQATGLGTSKDPGKLDMVPPSPTEIPDNMGIIAMTKRKAKTDHVKGDAGKVVREPAFSARTDKSIKDNLSQDGGNKLAQDDAAPGLLESGAMQRAAIRRSPGWQGAVGGLGGALVGSYLGGGLTGSPLGALGGMAAGGYGGYRLGKATAQAEQEALNDPAGAHRKGVLASMAAHQQALREHEGLQRAGGGVAGGILGGLGGAVGGAGLGGAVGGDRGAMLGAGIGGLAGLAGGAYGGQALGKATAKAEQSARRRMAEKRSSLQAGAARAYLAKLAAASQDPHASPAMRLKVAQFHQALDGIHEQRKVAFARSGFRGLGGLRRAATGAGRQLSKEVPHMPGIGQVVRKAEEGVAKAAPQAKASLKERLQKLRPSARVAKTPGKRVTREQLARLRPSAG